MNELTIFIFEGWRNGHVSPSVWHSALHHTSFIQIMTVLHLCIKQYRRQRKRKSRSTGRLEKEQGSGWCWQYYKRRWSDKIFTDNHQSTSLSRRKGVSGVDWSGKTNTKRLKSSLFALLFISMFSLVSSNGSCDIGLSLVLF